MEVTVRTTVRIRKDLFEHSRWLAFKNNLSLQEVINEALAVGYKHISNFGTTNQFMSQLDAFRQGTAEKSITIKKLVDISKKDQK